MKMAEYKDYMRLLFDKYLKFVPWILYLVIVISNGIGILIQHMTLEGAFNIVAQASLLIPIGYIIIRWSIIYLPTKLFGASNSAYNTIKNDIEEIHEKHSTSVDEGETSDKQMK